MIPLIYCNAGFREWTKWSISSVQKYTPDADIRLITDNNETYPGVKAYNMTGYHTGAYRLIKAYKHRSYNPDWFELGCLKRWPIVLDFVNQHNIDTFVVADWDILFCTDYNDLLGTYGKYDFTYQNSASIGLSLWTNRKALRWLVDLINDCYENPDSAIAKDFDKVWAWHQETKCDGGVSDMSFAVELIQKSGFSCFDTYTVQSDAAGGRFCWDNNMSHLDSGRWENTGKGVKNIQWKGHTPLCHNVLLGDVELKCMHFAGCSRQVMMDHFKRLMS